MQNVRNKGKRYLEQILSTFQDSNSDAVIGSKESISRITQHPTISYASHIWKRKDIHEVSQFIYYISKLFKNNKLNRVVHGNIFILFYQKVVLMYILLKMLIMMEVIVFNVYL